MLLNDSKHAVVLEDATLSWKRVNENHTKSTPETVSDTGSAGKSQSNPGVIISPSNVSISAAQKDSSNTDALHSITFAVEKVGMLLKIMAKSCLFFLFNIAKILPKICLLPQQNLWYTL